MRVLLIVPTYRYKDNYPAFLSASDFPTGNAYIAASLREAGHEVMGLNLNNIIGYESAHTMILNEITKALKKEPDLIGIGGLCIDYSFIKDAMGIIRYQSKVPIVLGGGIVNNDSEFIFNHLKPDYCIIGEAEETFVNLCDTLENKGDLSQIDNLGYREDGKAVFTKRNYDYPTERPFPDYDTFGYGEMVDKFSMTTRVLYRYSRTEPRPVGIVTARGCPFRCTFCVKHSAKYRARSIPNIMAEIKLLYDKYNFNILIIQDELFAVNKQRMIDFCEALIENKKSMGWDFDWMFQTHANARLDKGTLQLAKDAGCYFFSYGLESASPTVLKSMNKKTQVSQIEEVIKLAEEVGIGFGGNLIFGDMAETEYTLLDSLDFWAKHGKTNQIFLGFVSPYPGSELFDKCIEQGIIADKVKYYEGIERNLYQMTSIPNWVGWYDFLTALEGTWMFVDIIDGRYRKVPTDDYYINLCGVKMYEIHAICSHCNKEVVYKQAFDKITPRLFLGTGCTHCGRRIRINLKECYD